MLLENDCGGRKKKIACLRYLFHCISVRPAMVPRLARRNPLGARFPRPFRISKRWRWIFVRGCGDGGTTHIVIVKGRREGLNCCEFGPRMGERGRDISDAVTVV